MAEIGMTQRDLANRCGRPVQVINEIIRGKKAITQDTALELERVLGIPAHMWVGLEAEFQMTKARLRERDELDRQTEGLMAFPVDDMERMHWIPAGGTKTQRVARLLRFFGVASFTAYQTTAINGAGATLPTGANSELAKGALNAWLRKGEIDGHALQTEGFDRARFILALHEILTMTTGATSAVLPQVQAMCASAGVAVVLTQPLAQSGATGCTRWLTPSKALLQLCDRGAPANQLWFQFFHQSHHVSKQRTRRLFMEGVGLEDDEERDADRFAHEMLSPLAQPA